MNEQPGTTLGAAIGRAVERRRVQRGMSAAELARRAGLSKATLSLLEAGEGNPTIGTLASIAVALAIPLTDLVDHMADRGDIHIPADEARPTGISRQLLDRVPAGSAVEVWKLHMPADHAFDGVPHASGTVESLFVVDGKLTVTTERQVYQLRARDFLSFNGEQNHSYSTAELPANVLVLLAAP